MSSSNDANGSFGSGIRLPPISFLSGSQQPLRNPSNSGFGISSFLNSSPNKKYEKSEDHEDNKENKNDSVTNKLPSLSSFAGNESIKDEQAHVTNSKEQNSSGANITKEKEKIPAVSSNNLVEVLKNEPEIQSTQKEQQNTGVEPENTNGEKPVDQDHAVETIEVEKQSKTNEIMNNNVMNVIDNNQDKEIAKQKHIPDRLETGPILDIIKQLFPNRRNLGTIVYNPTTTIQTLQTAQLVGLSLDDYKRFEEIKINFREKISNPYYKKKIKYIPVIPPLSDAYINSLIEIKIPARHIQIFLDSLESNGEVVKKRELWGGASGVYTDDSDILCVLCHMGLFNNKIDLSEWNKTWKKSDIFSSVNNDDHEISDDLAVEVLLLPALPQYYGFYSNGINSRQWTGRNKHDGLSLTIYNVKWETSGSYLRDPKLFKRYQVESNKQYKVSKDSLSKNNWSISQKYYKSIKERIDKSQTPTTSLT